MLGQLDERFPILEVAADCIVSKMGDVSVVLEVEKPEIFTLGSAGYDLVHAAFVKALKVLPAGAVFHMQDVYWKDRHRVENVKGEKFFAAGK